jgi:hypothetical protein
MTKPYSLKVFLPGGDPDGVRIIEKSNWSGIGIVVPRPLFGEHKARKELARAGAYVLVGPPEGSGLPRVYVGEGDPIRPRLEQHAAKRDFWTSCIAFVSKDENLNKAHIQYLEARLIALAADAKRCTLENGNAPAQPSLSEADAADAEGVLAEMLLCFPVLGLGVFSRGSLPVQASRRLQLAGRGVEATGAELPDGFLVLKGSRASLDEVPSCHGYMKELRAALVANGVFQPNGSEYVFTQDYLFASPSTAAGVVLGRSANGRLEWKTKEGRALKEIQESEAGA